MKNGGIRRILQHDVLGEDEGASDAYTILNNALNTIINNFDAQSYSRYVAFPVMNEFSKKVENENGAKFRDGEDKKTASGKRGTADSHNPLSGSLLSGSSERLSGNTLAYPVDAAKVLENTEITKAKVKKIINEGGLQRDINAPMQAVSALGKGLGMQKSYSTQSYYGDYYEGDFSVNGKILHLRISTHPANGTRIGNALADDKISLVVRKNGEHVSLGEHNGYTEYVYEPSEILPKDAANGIVRTVERLIRTGEFVDETGGKGEIRISNTAVSKFLSESAVEKSDNKDVHLSVLKSLPEVIRESVDAEQHPDYKKGTDGKRSEKNGVNENVTIHRLYSAVNIDGQLYRVKITLKADKTNKEAKKAYSYEATKIELLAGQHEEAVTSSRNANNSITSAKLLNGVEKSYWNGEKIINSSKVLDENGEPLVVSHATDSDFTVFDKSKAGENTDSNATDENLAKVGASLLIV